MHFVHFEQAPPRSWDQFEELCADVFQDEWRDTGLVRHGRSGQSQDGVDIVGRDGALWPVGIQCKKKSTWPVKTLTRKDLEKEVQKAKAFKPALKAFYLVTTASDDEDIQACAREISAKHQLAGLFSVGVIGWGEIVRRAIRHPHVAAKHFGAYSPGKPTPLLASWRASAGKLLLDEAELEVAIRELLYDFREFPAGRLAFRTQEADDLLVKIRSLQSTQTNSLERRKSVLKHCERLYSHVYDEESVLIGLQLFFSHPDLSEYVRVPWDNDAPLLIRSFIEQQLDPNLSNIKGKEKIRLFAPHALPEPAGGDIAVFMPISEHNRTVRHSWELRAQYPKLNVEKLDELFRPVRFQYAIPAVMRGIVNGIRNGIPIETFEQANWLQFHLWKATY